MRRALFGRATLVVISVVWTFGIGSVSARSIRTDVGGNWGNGELMTAAYTTLFGETGYGVTFTPLPGVTDIGDDTGADSNGSLNLLQDTTTLGGLEPVTFDPSNSKIMNWYENPVTLVDGLPTSPGPVIGQVVELNVSEQGWSNEPNAEDLLINTDPDTVGGSQQFMGFNLDYKAFPYELTSIEEIQFNYPDGVDSCATGGRFYIDNPYQTPDEDWFVANAGTTVPPGTTSCNNTFLFATYDAFTYVTKPNGVMTQEIEGQYIDLLGGLPWGWQNCGNYANCAPTGNPGVPEPGTLALFAAGAVALWLVRQRRPKSEGLH
jgi:hypothetical protein